MSYDERSIKVLKGLEAVRKRPGMYIGSTGPDGLHHMIWEIVDNSIDEAMAGHCTQITIWLNKDGSISVHDNGRGIPVGMHEEGVPAVQVVLTKLHAGGKFDEKAYGASGGLHGVGASCVNALSRRLKVIVWRKGKQYHQSYARGVPTTDLEMGGASKKHGTTIRFWPDPKIFPDTNFDSEVITTRVRELSFLNPNVTFKFSNRGNEKTFKSEKGLIDYIDYLDPTPGICDVIACDGKDEGIYVSVALKWTKRTDYTELSFCNNINTHEGGTHSAGFKTALANAVMRHVLKGNKARCTPVSDDVKEGLTSIISVRVPQPQFEGQTKTKLGTASVKGIVQRIVYEKLVEAIHDNDKMREALANRIILTAKAREAAQKARDGMRKAASIGQEMLPGKLADCQSRNPAETELYLVEGESAGGSAKQGRDRKFQAILPLKGKILNVEGMPVSKILRTKEIQTLIAAVGAGIGSTFDANKLRYHKIIIMTDADVDGAHIRTLILTFFFRQMPELIINGNIYIAQPPLFKVSFRGKKQFCYNHADLKRVLEAYPDGIKPMVNRYKGLGEMPPQLLWDTTMDPENRILLQVNIDHISNTDQTFDILMGNSPEARADFINRYALKVNNLDV